MTFEEVAQIITRQGRFNQVSKRARIDKTRQLSDLGHIKITKCTIDRRDKNLAQASTIAVVLERQHTALGEIVQVFWFGHLLPVLVIFHFFVFLSIVAHR